MSKFNQIKDYREYLRHPEKYMSKNEDKPLVARSGLEINYFKKFDMNSKVKRWNSEEVIIPYPKPIFEYTTGVFKKYSVRKYYMDVWLLFENEKGERYEILGEIKPFSQTYKPKSPKRKTKKSQRNFINKTIQWYVNEAKWKQTLKYCEHLRKKGRNIRFQILTENKIIEYK